MFQSLSLQSVSAAVESFVADIHTQSPCRVEAKVASQDGMPLLCAVEAALDAVLARPAELVWLSGASKPGAHVLRLQAYGPDNELLAEAMHEFEA
jgi:hypothetical protein